MGRKIYRRDSNPGSIRGWPIIPMLHIYMVCLARLCKAHTYPVWGMTTLRQFRSSGPMRAPCSRGLSLGLLVPNVYWVLFFFVPGTLAAPCLTCFGFQPGCTFEANGKCPLVEIPVANLAEAQGLVLVFYLFFDFFSGEFYGTVSILCFTDFILFSCTFYAGFSAEFYVFTY